MRYALLVGLTTVLGCGDDSAGGDGGTGDPTTPTTSSGVGPDDGDDESSDPAADSETGDADTTAGPDTGLDTGAPDTDGGSTEGTTGGDDGPNVDLSDPQLYEFELDPLALDPTVVDNIELQYAHLDTRAQPLGKLVFFLSGFTNTPAAWRDHGRQLASYGFHVVEPHYNNSWSCGGMGGDCNADTRWEALTGEDTSTVIVASRADSAEGRVITMLEHLIDAHPGGDWGYYLNDDGTLRDEHVIIAGISHGASSSGLFASRRPFFRAVMHSGGWGAVGDDPATPIEAFYGLSHVDDEQHPGHLGAWDAAGLSGAPANINEMMPPYGDSHRLIASTPNGYPHCSVVVHSSSPMDGEDYVFDPAWRVLYGAPLR
ncbi:MAG: hypothetical protein AAF721_40580 [Myxococcota bacterium]